MLVVANLLRPRRITPVGLFPRNLVKHLYEIHVYAGIAFDEGLEFLEGGCKCLRAVGGDVVGYVVEVLAVDAMVGWEPCAWSGGRENEMLIIVYDMFVVFGRWMAYL